MQGTYPSIYMHVDANIPQFIILKITVNFAIRIKSGDPCDLLVYIVLNDELWCYYQDDNR